MNENNHSNKNPKNTINKAFLKSSKSYAAAPNEHIKSIPIKPTKSHSYLPLPGLFKFSNRRSSYDNTDWFLLYFPHVS